MVCAVLPLLSSSAAQAKQVAQQEAAFAIAIHGGAGTIDKSKMSKAKRLAYETKLTQARDKGYEMLADGQSSQAAVIAAIQILEDSPLFNAGKGAVYTFDGEHELDASIMNGKTLNAGAVSGVKTIKSPIALAEKIMEESVHVMLSGEGAEVFAKQQGLAQVENSHFDTNARYQALLKAKQKLAEKEKELNTSFFESLTFLRLFGSIEEQNNWFGKQAVPPFNKVLFDFKEDLSKYGVKNSFGLGRVNWSYRLHVEVFLEAVKNRLISKGDLIEGKFNYELLSVSGSEVSYNGQKAKGIIFCEGHQYIHNPYFNYIPEKLTKGEILKIKVDEFSPYAISKNCFILPLKSEEYILGATYDWSKKDYEPTEEAKNELLDKFKNISDKPVEVVEQRVGVRPTTIDRKPILGSHPVNMNLYIFNGLGSKGVQLVPYYASRMVEYLMNARTIEKEINSSRFTKKYFV